MKCKLIFLLLVTVFTLIASSCTKEKDLDEVNNINTDNSVQETMTVYLHPVDQIIYNPDGVVYNGVKIKAIPYYDVEEHFKKLSTELMSGEGPDIIDHADYFPSTSKVMESGVLYDLNQIIKNDPDVSLQEYNQVMLGSGVWKGKRYLIPLTYRISGVYTTRNILESKGIDADITKWTLGEFVQIANEYMKVNTNEGKKFIGFQLGKRDEERYKTYENILFARLFAKDLTSYIDFKEKKTDFSNGNFAELLELYKQLYPAICPEDTGYSLLKEDKAVIILNPNFGSPNQMRFLDSQVKDILGDDVLIGCLPSIQNDNVVAAEPRVMMGVNSRSKHKEAAFEYIKYLMSTDFYTSRPNQVVHININKDAYEKEKNISYSAAKDSFLQLDNLVKSVNKSEFMDISLTDIILNELPEFLNGKKTAEQTAKAIDVKVTLYMNE